MRKRRFENIKRRKNESEIDKQMTWKQALEKSFTHFELQKLTEIAPEMDQNPVICNFVSILLLPWFARVVPRSQHGVRRCSRDAKMAPRMSKRRHQEAKADRIQKRGGRRQRA